MTTLLFIVLVLVCYAVLFAAAWRGRETMLIMLAFVCTMSFLFATKIVTVAGYPLVPSAPFMAVIFYSSTILHEFFGAREARKVLVINLSCMIGFAGLGCLVRLMDMHQGLATEQLQLGQAYNVVFDFFPQALGAALLAFTSAYIVSDLLTRLLRRLTGTRLFALRGFIVVGLTNLWDIAAFIALAYAWSDATPSMIITTWLMRLACVALGVPILWQLKLHYKRLNATAAD